MKPAHTSLPKWLPFGAALGLSVAHLVVGMWMLPHWMFAKYPDGARLLRLGQLRPEESADLSPLYLVLNAALPPAAVRTLQSLAGAAAVLVLYFMGARLFSRSVGVLSAALFAAASPVLLYEATLEPDLFVAVLGAAALALLVLAGQATEKWWPPLAAGAALGLSAALRPSAIPFAGAALLWLGLRAYQAGPRSWRGPAVFVAALALGLAGPLVGLRLWAGPELKATMSAGQVMHQGNRPESTGLGAQVPQLIKLIELQERSSSKPDHAHALGRRMARAAAGVTLSAWECELFWLQRTWAFAERFPGAFGSLLGRKLAFFSFGPEAHDLVEVTRAQKALPRGIPIRLDWLGYLGLAGLFAAIALRKRVEVLLIYLACLVIVVAASYVSSLYRLSIVPVWCVFAAFFLDAAARALRTPRTLAVLAAALLGVVFLRYASPFIGSVEALIARGADAAAMGPELERARATGALDRAASLYVQTQAAQPMTVLTRNLRGIPFESKALAEESVRFAASRYGAGTDADKFIIALLSFRAGRCDAALEGASALEKTGFHAAVFDRSLDPALVAMGCLLERGDRSAALDHVMVSLRNRPGTLEGLAAAVAGSSALPQQAGARRLGWEEDLFALHDPMSARFALARAHNQWGSFKAALQDADVVLAKLPEAAVVRYERARALAGLGRDLDAARDYLQALRGFPRHAFATAPLDGVVASLGEEVTRDSAMAWLAIEHYLRAGQVAEARSLAEQVRADRSLAWTAELDEQAKLLSVARANETWGAR